MALRTELGIPPAHMLLMELREEVRDRLEDTSSRAWRRRLRFKEPGLGTKGWNLGVQACFFWGGLPFLPSRLLSTNKALPEM